MVVAKAVLEVVVMGAGEACEEGSKGRRAGRRRRAKGEKSRKLGRRSPRYRVGVWERGWESGRGGAGNGEAARHPNKAQPDLHRE